MVRILLRTSVVSALAIILSAVAFSPAWASGAATTGTVSGQILEADGTPSVHTRVFFETDDTTTIVYFATTTGDGSYSADDVPPGEYRVHLLRADDGAHQWVPQTFTQSAATVFQVSAGAERLV